MDRAQRRDECLLWAILDRAKWLTLGQCCAASEVGLEPKAEVSDFCCVRSRRGNCCNSVNLDAAAQQEKRPFMRAAVLASLVVFMQSNFAIHLL